MKKSEPKIRIVKKLVLVPNALKITFLPVYSVGCDLT